MFAELQKTIKKYPGNKSLLGQSAFSMLPSRIVYCIWIPWIQYITKSQGLKKRETRTSIFFLRNAICNQNVYNVHFNKIAITFDQNIPGFLCQFQVLLQVDSDCSPYEVHALSWIMRNPKSQIRAFCGLSALRQELDIVWVIERVDVGARPALIAFWAL